MEAVLVLVLVEAWSLSPLAGLVVRGQVAEQTNHGHIQCKEEHDIQNTPERLGIMAVQTQLHADIARNEQKQTTR